MADVDWEAIMGALAAYLGSRGNSGDTPNFYNVPMTPEEKAWNDRRMAMYDAGGSTQMKAAGSAAQQFFAGMPTTANPRFASPFMQGQPFAGGIQLPKIDLSRFDFSAPPPGAGAGIGGSPGGNRGGGAPRDAVPGGGGPNEGGGPFGGSWGPSGQVGGGSTAGEKAGQFADWWARYRAQNPNWWKDGAKAAVLAATQQYGPMAAQLVRMFMTGRPQALPAPTRGLQDFNPFGTMDENGAAPLPSPTRGLEDFDPPGTRDEYGNPPPKAPVPPKEDYWGGTKTPYWNNPYAYSPAKPFTYTPGIARAGRYNR